LIIAATLLKLEAMIRRLCKTICLLALSFAFHQARGAEPPSVRPNILFILADDLGFSDIGCYGGEISTPNLDKLAAQGVRFTQFYNTGRCWPTRAALLTGYYAQQIRMDPPAAELPGWTRLLPQYLKPLGYRSYHSGKWHIQAARLPVRFGGFDRSYRLEDHNRNFYPTNHWIDDVRQPPVTKGSNYYTTTAFADFLITCLKEHSAKYASAPFFAYLPFTVPHFPLQAPPQDIARYRDKYLAGWDVIRKKRYERQRQMGIVDCALSAPEPEIVAHWSLIGAELKKEIGPGEVVRAVRWSELSDEERRFQATKMAIHAAMIDRMDREIGRVLEQLKAMGAFENTIILFASDNGASAEFLNRGDKHDPSAPLGSGGSYLCLGPGWSTAGNTPFRLHKSWTHEGGIATPLIVHWPKGISAHGELRHAPGHVIDFVPTVLDVLGVMPEQTWNGSKVPPLPGRSLQPVFAKDAMIERDYLFFHHENNRAVRIGDWKLVSKRPDTNSYALYNLKNDRAEEMDLAGEESKRAGEMSSQWAEIEAAFRELAGPLDAAPRGRNSSR
jgi:arylsulfatase A-like enzyme